MSAVTNSIGEWVEGVFEKIFFQPDDQIAMQFYDDYIPTDLQLKINGVPYSSEDFKAQAIESRKKAWIISNSSRELLKELENGDEKSGSVAHFVEFTVKDKESGAEVKKTSVTIATVAWKDNKRVLSQLTEVAT